MVRFSIYSRLWFGCAFQIEIPLWQSTARAIYFCGRNARVHVRQFPFRVPRLLLPFLVIVNYSVFGSVSSCIL
jgi:hypothetical protein